MAQVPKHVMEPGATYSIAPDQWIKSQGSGEVNWNEIFGEPGTYDIGIVVDYNTMAGEDAQGRSNNRGENVSPPNGIIRTITITAPPNPLPSSYEIFVPVIHR
jgi:hypothetical protein